MHLNLAVQNYKDICAGMQYFRRLKKVVDAVALVPSVSNRRLSHMGFCIKRNRFGLQMAISLLMVLNETIARSLATETVVAHISFCQWDGRADSIDSVIHGCQSPPFAA